MFSQRSPWSKRYSMDLRGCLQPLWPKLRFLLGGACGAEAAPVGGEEGRSPRMAERWMGGAPPGQTPFP